MERDTLQHSDLRSNFTGFNNYSSDFHPQEIQEVENPSSNINYNDGNISYTDDVFMINDVFPSSYEDSISSMFNASTSHASHIGQANEQILDQNLPLSTNNISSYNTTINSPQPPSNPEIFSFDIPGFKIIVIPVSSNIITNNPQTQFQQFQQQNPLNESFNNHNFSG